MRALVFVICVLLGSTRALACGFCVEDKIAAVYDHALLTQALARGHHVAFFAIDGALDANSAQKSGIERAAAKAAGVDAKSIRVSVESAALSASFDPARISVEQLRQSLQKALVLKNLSLQLLRVTEHLEKPKTETAL
jgi:hypothetical protein